MNWIKRAWAWLIGRASPSVEVVSTEEKDFEHVSSLFTFRKGLLEQLERYFTYLARLRRVDREAYDLFSQTGLALSPYHAGYAPLSFTHSWAGGERPSHGGVFWVPPEKGEYMGPAFAYFMKHKRAPHGVAWPKNGGVVYTFTLYIDDETDTPHKQGAVLVCHVSVAPDGSIQLLKEKTTSYHQADVPHHAVSYPTRLVGWHAEGRKKHPDSIPASLEEWVAQIFRIVANATATAAAGLQVRVSKGPRVAAFGIEMERTPYFFKDRDLVVNENGNRKRVFHIVKTFQRASGKYVKTHFRGARKFTWQGTDVVISMPGYHHADMARFQGAMEEVDKVTGKHLTAKEAGATIRAHVSA